MALVERLENCKRASSYELRAASCEHPQRHPATPHSRLATLCFKIIARRNDGAEIAEAALVLPLVFMFLLGIVWFGRAFNIYTTITQAAQQGAITAARASCATCNPNPNTFPDKDAVSDAVIAVLKASNLDPSQIIQDNPAPLPCSTSFSGCQTSQKVTVCRDVLLNPNAGNSQPSQCGTLVSFDYPFQFYLPFTSLNQRQIVLSAQSQSRMEQ